MTEPVFTIRSLVAEAVRNLRDGDLNTAEINLRSINAHLDYMEGKLS